MNPSQRTPRREGDALNEFVDGIDTILDLNDLVGAVVGQDPISSLLGLGDAASAVSNTADAAGSITSGLDCLSGISSLFGC